MSDKVTTAVQCIRDTLEDYSFAYLERDTVLPEDERALEELERLARLGAAVEAIKEKHGNEKIRVSIGVMNLLYAP